ncbi:hypothetical protein [Xylella fastidiosa]|uniref:Uncharacterized protein n=1 Tax=Xylella fastidiosa subsp. fastidiosa TaxID=644356 RepID=A0AAJ5UJ23_XYLFS|nr:hypothetical protein [Xylella fastidiosa]AIC13627.1 hypothetical protein P303_03770 [Xylella fastidiosa MUL0034]WCF29037.1 hypothetical protein OK117_03985 [Xylella fastidiosa subsp. fastidiosa]
MRAIFLLLLFIASYSSISANGIAQQLVFIFGRVIQTHGWPG